MNVAGGRSRSSRVQANDPICAALSGWNRVVELGYFLSDPTNKVYPEFRVNVLEDKT
jgi:hypothetical protein